MLHKMQSQRDDQLRMKLMLYLGSQVEWLEAYANWCADNDVGSVTELYDDHNIGLFVKQQREAKK